MLSKTRSPPCFPNKRLIENGFLSSKMRENPGVLFKSSLLELESCAFFLASTPKMAWSTSIPSKVTPPAEFKGLFQPLFLGGKTGTFRGGIGTDQQPWLQKYSTNLCFHGRLRRHPLARRIWGQLLFEVVVLVQGVDPPEKRSIHNPKSYHFLTLGEIRSVSGGVYKVTRITMSYWNMLIGNYWVEIIWLVILLMEEIQHHLTPVFQLDL